MQWNMPRQCQWDDIYSYKYFIWNCLHRKHADCHFSVSLHTIFTRKENRCSLFRVVFPVIHNYWSMTVIKKQAFLVYFLYTITVNVLSSFASYQSAEQNTAVLRLASHTIYTVPLSVFSLSLSPSVYLLCHLMRRTVWAFHSSAYTRPEFPVPPNINHPQNNKITSACLITFLLLCTIIYCKSTDNNK